MASFQYRSLESESHFRILYLDHGAGEEQLSASLVHHNLDEYSQHHPYDCLSYTWGCSTLSHHILIDGSHLPITANLYFALTRIRALSTCGQIAIWADGICINQQDILERNQQMRLMRRIYSECRTGLLYLGEEANGSDSIPDFLTTLGQSMIVLFKTTKTPELLDFRNEAAFPEENDPGWEILKALLRRPWFRRVWIIQEFALPPQIEMLCGQWKISGSDLAALLQIPIWSYSQRLLTLLLHDPETGAAIESHRLHLMARIGAGRNVGPKTNAEYRAMMAPGLSTLYQSLIWLLDQSSSFLATDPRDKIFALMPLSSNSSDPTFTVDYSKAIEVVLLETAQYFVRNGYGLSLLLSAHSRSSSENSPSWFPKWASPANPNYFNVWPMRYGKLPDCQIIANSESNTVTVIGYFIDIVQNLTIPIGRASLLDKDNEWIMDVDNLVSEIQTYPTGQAVSEAVWRTLIADRTIEKKSPAPEGYGYLYHLARNSKAVFDLDTRSALQMFQDLENTIRFEGAIRRESRFSITRNGFFAMLPKSAEVGDVVFVVKGDEERATFLVRRDPGLDQYQLLGHAYVHDIRKALPLDEYQEQRIIIN